MVNHPIACGLWRKLAQLPGEYWDTPEGEELRRKAVALVAKEAGEQEARNLDNLIECGSLV